MLRINSGIDEAEHQIRDLGDKEAENMHSVQQKKNKNKKKLGQFKEPLGQPQAYNIGIIGVPEGKKRARNCKPI